MNIYKIAVDGPAGSGKSTIAKIIAKKLNIMYLDTGAMYRAIAYKILNKNIKIENINDIVDMMKNTKILFDKDIIFLDGINVSKEIRMPNVSNFVSKVASIKEVREHLVKLQTNIANNNSVIMDGRDIGTVVLKDAQFKFFLNASIKERANRRYKEMIEKKIEVDFDNIYKEISQRDLADINRKESPLAKASDAIEIDTSTMNIDEVVLKLLSIINN
ncbi:(d)CMP kinase [Helicovermis profundi]|uniref:Cytidylate kinase n=1 Tax=Helicovermis profundi TaxID=3065157 RepID=A0AAU9ENZ0_9FIRM|nr:(d)CMP kinase [Clostridia bacterium S502]